MYVTVSLVATNKSLLNKVTLQLCFPQGFPRKQAHQLNHLQETDPIYAWSTYRWECILLLLSDRSNEIWMNTWLTSFYFLYMINMHWCQQSAWWEKIHEWPSSFLGCWYPNDLMSCWNGYKRQHLKKFWLKKDENCVKVHSAICVSRYHQIVHWNLLIRQSGIALTMLHNDDCWCDKQLQVQDCRGL